jgi:hypothetical protein
MFVNDVTELRSVNIQSFLSTLTSIHVRFLPLDGTKKLLHLQLLHLTVIV